MPDHCLCNQVAAGWNPNCLIHKDALPRRWQECPDYDGVPERGGPCWTCQNGRGPCPLDAAGMPQL